MSLKIPMLVTSAINVDASNVKLSDPDERLRVTLEALEEIMSQGVFSSFVVCDGSGFDFSSRVRDIAKRYSVKVESLYFQNSSSLVEKFGTGYGEGEIMNYALSHSEILNGTEHFSKITSKLYVKNFQKLVDSYNGVACFDFRGRRYIDSIDTRFFIVQKSFYLSRLSDAYKNVNDPVNFFYEHAFTDALKNEKCSHIISSIPINVHGVSGHTGVEYDAISYLRSFQLRLRNLIFSSLPIEIKSLAP